MKTTSNHIDIKESTHNQLSELKSTLDNTLTLALGLEQVSSMIVPRKIGQRGRKRLININREMKNLSILIDKRTKNNSLNEQEKIFLKKPRSKADINNNLPSSSVKRKLSASIREVNQRLKLSRAGKDSIGIYLSAQQGNASKDLHTNYSSFYKGSSQRVRTEGSEEKPQPYVSMLNGKIEDPITLPTYEEYLESTGDEFSNYKGKDLLFYRIDKAADQIDKLSDALNQRSLVKNAEEKLNHTNRRLSAPMNDIKDKKRDSLIAKLTKKNDLRMLMNQYYNMPSFYKSPKTNRKFFNDSPNSVQVTLSNEIEESMDEALRLFNKVKAVENRKLNDILEKISADRPELLKKKFGMIQNDKEKYKNKHYSIEKFNSMRENIEKNKRNIQFKAHEQGLVYLEVLDEFKRKRYEPSHSELLLLDLWKRTVESGCVISKQDFTEIISMLSPEETQQKELKLLLNKLFAIC